MLEVSTFVEMGPQRLAGMYLVPRTSPLPAWVGADAIPVDEPAGPIRPIATTCPDPDGPLRRAFLDLINSGQRKVLLASFLFADGEVARALARVAERLRGGVYVLTALGRGFRVDLGDAEGLDPHSRGSERREQHITNLKLLADAGVWLRSAPDLHAKLCVIDDREALVTSANVTSEAFDRNPENGLILRSPALARELGRAFARVFLHHSREESPPAATLNVGSVRSSLGPRWRRLTRSEPDQVVATISDDEQSIMEAILDLLQSARSEIVLTAYSAVGLQDHPVGVALRSAVGRGVRVLAVLPPDNRAADRRDTGAWLFRGAKEGQVVVRGLAYTHAKAIVSDGVRALVWTGNLDGHHGFEDGFEVGVTTSRPEVARALRAYVVTLANKAQYTALFDPTLEQLAAACGTTSGISGDWVIELPTHAFWRPSELADALKRSAISFTRRGGELTLGIEGIAELIGTVDASNHRLKVERIISKPTNPSRPEGYLGPCRLRVTRDAGPEASKGRARRGGDRRS
ncbi:hypothetical protein BE04_37740 [Sorangium cellulosum]|uniref:phospholipase D n=1 Tax=Sorangium cellulosum TaxID=56 RepID=A0A150P0V4_SORCE|nr:hypothetical protein BE04_37740 [Sorangium cellulosum]